MKKTYKLFALVLAIIMATATFSCALGQEEKQTITWLGYYTSDITVAENSYAEKLLEEAFNVEIIPVTDVSSESMPVFISSGEILDVTCYASYLNKDFTYMYDQELIREFPAEWLNEYYPTGMKIYEDYLGKKFFEQGNHLVDGKALYTPFTTTTNTSQLVMVYRKDWMENLGMSEPTTLDELHDLLYAFTFNDPDGNGKDDTYGIDASWDWFGLWPVYGAFGFVNDTNRGNFYLQEDGSVIYTPATQEYMQALTIIKAWYDEGIIDPNCITDDRSAVRTKWANGTIGTMVDSQTWFYSNRGSSSIIALAEDVFGEGTVDVMGALTTDHGDGKVYSATKFPNVSSNRALCFSANATDEQIIAVLKMLEGMASDNELFISVVYGEEGVDYTWAEDGQLIVSPDLNIEKMAAKGISDTFYGYGATDEYIESITFSARDKANVEKCDTWPTLYWSNNFTEKVNEMYNTYYSEVQKIEKEFYASILLGKSTINSDWDAYVTKLGNAGLTKIIAEYEALLK